MSIDVECSVCAFTEEVEEVTTVFELQERHQERLGDHHVLEFERTSGDRSDDG